MYVHVYMYVYVAMCMAMWMGSVMPNFRRNVLFIEESIVGFFKPREICWDKRICYCFLFQLLNINAFEIISSWLVELWASSSSSLFLSLLGGGCPKPSWSASELAWCPWDCLLWDTRWLSSRSLRLLPLARWSVGRAWSSCRSWA